MKNSTLSLGWKHFLSEKVQNRKYHLETKVERDALCYDAHNNRYSISAKSISPNLFYSMELGARSLIDVWPFFNDRLLDIGCGQKPYALLINSLVKKYIGLDLPGQDEVKCSDIFADGLSIPFKSESFATVLATDMLDEVASPLHLLWEANRVLKPDGHLIVLVSNHYDIFQKGTVYAQYTADGLRYLAEKSGFNVVLMKTKGKLLPFFFNLMVQFLYRCREKISKFHIQEMTVDYFHHFNSFMLVLQKFLVRLTPSKSVKTDVTWEDSPMRHVILGSFHLGYVMVAKKVFSLDRE